MIGMMRFEVIIIIIIIIFIPFFGPRTEYEQRRIYALSGILIWNGTGWVGRSRTFDIVLCKKQGGGGDGLIEWRMVKGHETCSRSRASRRQFPRPGAECLKDGRRPSAKLQTIWPSIRFKTAPHVSMILTDPFQADPFCTLITNLVSIA